MSKKDFVYFADVTTSDFVIMIIHKFINFSLLPLQINTSIASSLHLHNIKRKWSEQ